MPLSEELVRENLKKVIDPELFVNIVDLGLIYGVTIEPAPTSAVSPSDSAAATDAQPAPAATDATPEPASGPKENVKIEMTMTSPACPAGPQLIAQSKDAIKRLDGVNDVEVKLVMTPPWTPDRMTEDARDQLGIF